MEEPLRATLGFLEKLSLQPDDVRAEDAGAVLAAGVREDALVDAIHIAALFTMIVRLADSFGWHVPLDRELAAQAALSPTRMFVGKDYEGRATLALSDAQGKQRLLLTVDRTGAPKIQFLDEAGKVVREIVP